MGYRFEVTDVTGTVWRSDEDHDDLTPPQRDQIEDTFRDLSDLNDLRITRSGSVTYFNPKHVIAVSIVETEATR